MTFFLPQFLSTWKTLKFYSHVRVDSPRQVIAVNECKYNAVGRGSAFSTHERNSSTTQIDVKHCQMFTGKKKIPFFLPISLPAIFDRSTGHCPCRTQKRHAVQTWKIAILDFRQVKTKTYSAWDVAVQIHPSDRKKRKGYLISLLQIASGVSNSPRNISENFSGS